MTINIDELRRLVQAAMTGPDGVSLNWVKLLQDFQKEANPATVSELLDRLEEAERASAHIKEVEFPRKMRAVAVGWETKCARLEQERDALLDCLKEWKELAKSAEKERNAMRAKIEAMEKQEPVAQVGVHKTGGNAGIAWSARPLNEFDSLPPLCDGDKLYLNPGAQPAPSISPVALRHVIQWLRNGCDPMKAADELEMLAAAPEAKP